MNLRLPSFTSDDDVTAAVEPDATDAIPEVDVINDEQTASIDKPKAETAGVWNVERESMCPACGKPMRNVTAAGIPSFVCMDDRVVLPVKQTEFSTKQG